MSLRDLQVKAVYHPGKRGENILYEMLLPALKQATLYQRVAGYFSSTALAVAAQGISGLVENGGKYQLVTSHELVKTDYTNLNEAYSSEEFETSLIESFRESWAKLQSLESALQRKHVEAMLWMLKEGILEVRVVVPFRNEQVILDQSLVDKFHPKFGIITDSSGDSIAFSGSANESMNAWVRNLENVMVYQSWIPEKNEYIVPLQESFNDYWNGQNIPGWKTINLPEAVVNRIVNDYSPEHFPDIAELEALLGELANNEDSGLAPKDHLWPHQRKRVGEWVSVGMKGLLEMATGTGKTKTAVECVNIASSLGSLLTVVGVPFRHIGDQWAEELKDYSPITIDGTSDWRKAIRKIESLAKSDQITRVVLIGVKDTLASSECQKMLDELSQYFTNYLLVADEAHWFGARTYSKALSEKANFRLGLSATPSRYFDDEGTQVLENYFQNSLEEFDLAAALSTNRPGTNESILCPYSYHPVIVSLEADEQETYNKLTRIIQAQDSSKDPEERAKATETRIVRSRVTKKAMNKIPAFAELISDLGPDLKHCLVYCEDNEQLELAAEVMYKAGMKVNKITSNESATPSEKWAGLSQRSHYIQSFERGDLAVLLSMDCLDEGVDIPPARIGILLASSGNIKEFVQRRGRIMRRAPGKNLAEIYDFVVAPKESDSFKVLNAETKRLTEFAKDAVNRDEIEEIFEGQLVIE